PHWEREIPEIAESVPDQQMYRLVRDHAAQTAAVVGRRVPEHEVLVEIVSIDEDVRRRKSAESLPERVTSQVETQRRVQARAVHEKNLWSDVRRIERRRRQS